MILMVLLVVIVNYNAPIKENNMTIKSPAFENGDLIPPRYTCDGENINPPLVIGGVPKGTADLVLIMDDPDAPGGTWVHWTLWNIDPLTTEIPEKTVPIGATEGVTNFGKPGYGGPCPPASRGGPSGSHRYFFKLYALNEKLTLPKETKKEDLEIMMEGKVLEEAHLMGIYSRKPR